MNRLGRYLHKVWWRFLFETAEAREVHGITVAVANNGAHAPTEEVFAAAERALALIARHQPLVLARMQRDLSRIWIFRYAVNRGLYDPRTRTCITDTSFVVGFPPEIVASTLVHEATHARIRRAVRRWPKDAAEKEERICRRAELRLARALPDGAAVTERVVPMLTRPDVQLSPEIDWHAAGDRASRIRLREAPGPGWLKHVVAWAAGWGPLSQKD